MILSGVVFTVSWSSTIQQPISDWVRLYIPSAPKDINWLAIISVVLFLSFVIWALWDLSVRVQKLEDNYHYALGFGGLELQFIDSKTDFHIVLKLLNTLEVPIEYKLDLTKYYVEIDGIRIAKPDLGWKGNIIYKQTPQTYIFPGTIHPKKFPAKGKLHYELAYGRPGGLMYYQTREMSILMTITPDNEIYLQWAPEIQHDIPIPRDIKKQLKLVFS